MNRTCAYPKLGEVIRKRAKMVDVENIDAADDVELIPEAIVEKPRDRFGHSLKGARPLAQSIMLLGKPVEANGDGREIGCLKRGEPAGAKLHAVRRDAPAIAERGGVRAYELDIMAQKGFAADDGEGDAFGVIARGDCREFAANDIRR